MRAGRLLEKVWFAAIRKNHVQRFCARPHRPFPGPQGPSTSLRKRDSKRSCLKQRHSLSRELLLTSTCGKTLLRGKRTLSALVCKLACGLNITMSILQVLAARTGKRCASKSGEALPLRFKSLLTSVIDRRLRLAVIRGCTQVIAIQLTS